MPRLRASAAARHFLDGLDVASLALMAVVTLRLGRAAMTDAFTTAVVAASVILLTRYEPNSVWLVFAGGALGAVVHRFR